MISCEYTPTCDQWTMDLKRTNGRMNFPYVTVQYETDSFDSCVCDTCMVQKG